jgi:large repetitive protein
METLLMKCNALAVCVLLCCALPAHAWDHRYDQGIDALWQDYSAMEKQARTDRADANEYIELMTAAVRLQAEFEAGTRALTVLEAERLWHVLNTPLDIDVPPPVAGSSNGTFQGVVLEQGSGAPLTSGSVRAIPWDNPFFSHDATIQSDGSYSLSVPPGHYVLHTVGTPEHVRLAWPDISCFNPGTCSPWYGGEVIEIGSGDVVVRDFAVERGVRAQGTVTDGQGSPVEDAIVTLRSRSGYSATAATSASGEYTIDQALPPGKFRVYVTPPAGSSLLGVLNDGQSCTEECGSLPVSYLELDNVASPTTVDLEMADGFGLSGSVDSGGQPQEGVAIRLYSDDGHTVVSANTDAAGEYEFPALRPTDYRIVVHSPATLNQVYPGLDCFGSDCAPEAGSPVALGDAPVTRNFSLAPGASISGQITRASDGAPAVNARVAVSNAAQGAHWAWADANGEYTVSGLVEGTFYVMAIPDMPDGDHRQTYLGNVACPATACGELGQPLGIPATGNVASVDIELVEGGGVSGQIFDAETGLSLSSMTGARLELLVASGPFQGKLAAQPMVQMDGTYSAHGLVPGAYKAVFATTTHLGLIDTAFGGQPCPRGACDLDALPTVFVTAGTVLSGIDGTLPRGPVISGQVIDADTGEPPPPLPAGTYTSRLMAFYGTSGNYASFSNIDGEGNFRSRTGFPVGTFFASTFLNRNMVPFGDNYIDQAYDGLDCPRLKCNLTASASAINVAGSDVDGIDFSLRQGGGISGVVTDDDGGAPLAGVAIEAYDGSGRLVAETASNVLGQYTIDALPTGNYTVRTRNRQGYQNQIHDGGSCTPFCDPQSGTPIAVSEGSVTSGIDFALVRSVAISGTVRVDGVPAGNITVEAYGAIGNLVSETLSQPDGSYAFTNLAPGQFYLRTRNAFGHADVLYSGKPCVGEACRIRQGDPIMLDPGQSVAGVDLELVTGATVSGEVHDRSDPSNKLSGVRVQLLDDRGVVAFEATTGSGGAFTLAASPPATIILSLAIRRPT